jgi:hypothetical protein
MDELRKHGPVWPPEARSGTAAAILNARMMIASSAGRSPYFESKSF